ncbi:MAG: penicillin amidase, partial [Myxococcota bacterium]
MRHTPRLIAAILATLFFGGLGCSDDKEGSDDTTVTDTVDDSTDADDTSVVPLEYTAPDYFPDLGATADEVVAADTLSGSVRVIRDSRGIPHIYGDKVEDVSWAQGYVTARDRMFQMHTLRRAASGRLAELSGVGGLSGDFLLRLLDLRGAAEGMVTLAENEDPALFAVMQSFTAGVNAYLARARAGEEQVSLEVTLFGADTIEDWSMVDTMVIVRLQTWDLSFDMSDVARLERVIAIREAHAGTAIEGVEKDAFNFAPIDKTATLEPDGGANATGTYDLLTTLSDDFFKTLNAADLKKHVQPFDAFDKAKHHAFRGPDYGSNNWLVSGSLTASTKPLVSNDTHLALRNPAVFYQVHVSNKLAGGALNANGINFAGAPGIVLGHNDHAAWGGTVFFSDVTDAYIEQVSADGTTVTYDGAQRALIEREETFNFILTGDATTCLELAPAWAAAANPRETIVGGRCSLTVTFLHVPDRGPILPWTYTGEGAERRVTSLQWTGFKPTGELSAVWKLNMMTSVAEFKAALDEFDVGAQNWVAGFTNGDIAWYPSHQLPIRKHIAAGDTTYPPFLPMPGHSSDYAWDGFVPRDELPQATNPEKGWLATANGDPIGTSFDNDPFNEAHYLGYQWKPGFRIGRVTERLTELAARGDVTSAEMSAVQGDGRSNYGRVMTASVLEAIDAAQDGTDTRAAALLTDGNSAAVEAAEGYLRGWEALGYDAASGAGADAASDEAKASVATSIFNVWAVLAIKNALDDEGLTSGIRVERLL